jgi:hypothetical protein
MTDSRYVVVEICRYDLLATEFESYEEALKHVEGTIEKAYIIRIEDFCADAFHPINITLEPHN